MSNFQAAAGVYREGASVAPDSRELILKAATLESKSEADASKRQSSRKGLKWQCEQLADGHACALRAYDLLLFFVPGAKRRVALIVDVVAPLFRVCAIRAAPERRSA